MKNSFFLHKKKTKRNIKYKNKKSKRIKHYGGSGTISEELLNDLFMIINGIFNINLNNEKKKNYRIDINKKIAIGDENYNIINDVKDKINIDINDINDKLNKIDDKSIEKKNIENNLKFLRKWEAYFNRFSIISKYNGLLNYNGIDNRIKEKIKDIKKLNNENSYKAKKKVIYNTLNNELTIIDQQKQNTEKQELDAVTKIQAVERGRNQRKELETQRKAATTIQKIVRKKQERLRNQASTKIQSMLTNNRERKIKEKPVNKLCSTITKQPKGGKIRKSYRKKKNKKRNTKKKHKKNFD